MKEYLWDILLILGIILICLLPLSYFAALGIAKTMHPDIPKYDPRSDPMCDPITGEMKPDACNFGYSNEGRSRLCFSQCYLSKNATITDVNYNIIPLPEGCYENYTGQVPNDLVIHISCPNNVQVPV
jgi:hypothetical protein